MKSNKGSGSNTQQTPQWQDQTSFDPIITDLTSIIKNVWHKAPRICAIGLVAAILCYTWIMYLKPEAYSATEKLYVSGGSNAIVDLSDLQLGSTLSSDYQEVFTNKEVHEKVRENLYLEYTDEELNKMISIVNSTGRILAITITSQQSEYEALRMTEEYCEAARLFIEERMGGRMPSIFEKATINDNQRHQLRWSVIAFVVACILAAGCIVIWQLLDDRINSRKHVVDDAGLLILGVVPGARKAAVNAENAKA